MRKVSDGRGVAVGTKNFKFAAYVPHPAGNCNISFAASLFCCRKRDFFVQKRGIFDEFY